MKKIFKLISSNKFGMGYAITAGAVVSTMIYYIGHSIGNLEGFEESNQIWKDAINKLKEEENSQTENEE